MKATGSIPLAVAIGLLLAGSARCVAQEIFFLDWNVAGPAPWDDDLNWVDSLGEMFTPEAEFDEGARFSNGGTAEILSGVTDVKGLAVGNGTVDIQQGGSLNVTTATTVQGAGTIRLSGNGSFQTGSYDGRGRIDLNGNEVKFSVEDDLTRLGSLELDISNAGHAGIEVGGAALVDGTVIPNFAPDVGFEFGTSWPFLKAGSIAGVNAEVRDAPPLPPGLGFVVTREGDEAALTIGSLPVLSIDRATGRGTVKNIVGAPVTMTGYTIASASGLLNGSGFAGLESQEVDGWFAAPANETGISEASLLSSATLNVGDSIDLGNVYAGAVNPREEDVTFHFATPDGRVLAGSVEYTGPAHDLVLQVDPEKGDAAIQNLSSKVDPFEITGYSILSVSESLMPEGWNSFADSGQAGEGWNEANPVAGGLAEANLTGAHLFGGGTQIEIGSVFNPGGLKDLVFLYATTEGEVLPGTVEYGPISPAGPGLDCNGDGLVDVGDLACSNAADTTSQLLAQLGLVPGDVDGQGGVSFADFLVLSANFGQPLGQYDQGDIDGNGDVGFPDFLVLSSNFGASAPAATAVPEPTTVVLLSLSGLVILGCRTYRAGKGQRR